MPDDSLQLAVTTASLPGEVREVFDRVASLELRYVQLSAAQPGFRPRELGQSARRDVLATLRRRGLAPSGLDLWIPLEHFSRPERADEAVGALLQALQLAADLGRIPLSTTLPAAGADRTSADDAGPPRRNSLIRIERGAAGGIILPRRTLSDPAGLTEVVLDRAAHLGVPVIDFPRPADVDAMPFHEFRRLGIDPPAWLAHDEDPVSLAAQRAADLGAVRLVDLLETGHRGPIGDEAEGRLDLLRLQVVLSMAARVAGVIDPRGWRDPWSGLETSLSAWRSALPFAGPGGA